MSKITKSYLILGDEKFQHLMKRHFEQSEINSDASLYFQSKVSTATQRQMAVADIIFVSLQDRPSWVRVLQTVEKKIQWVEVMDSQRIGFLNIIVANVYTLPPIITLCSHEKDVLELRDEKNGKFKLLLKDIVYLVAADNYTDIFTADSKRVTRASRSLKSFATVLTLELGFMRLNRTHLVNLKNISSYNDVTNKVRVGEMVIEPSESFAKIYLIQECLHQLSIPLPENMPDESRIFKLHKVSKKTPFTMLGASNLELA